MSIRIILADDHKIVRDGLRSLIEKEEDLELVAAVDSGNKAVRLAVELSPQVVVMDISMPGMNGVDATREIITAVPQCKVIALSMHADRQFVMAMLKAGASGYLLKDCAFELLAYAIRTVFKNKMYLCPPIDEIIIGDYVQQLQQQHDGSVFSVLSSREREVLQLLSEGNSSACIASQLYISVKTVETHRQRIMMKLDIHNLAGLTKYAIREGLTSL